MHITVIRHSIRNRGGDKVVLDYLSFLADNGHRITYWTNEINTRFKLHPAIELKMIPIKGIFGTLFFTLVTRFNTDVLLVDLVIMALTASFQNKQKVFFLGQDDDVTYHKSIIIKKFTAFCYSMVLNKLQIPTVSESDGLTERLNQYKPKNLTTISNGVDTTFFFRDPQSPYLSMRKKPIVITIFCRSDYRKGLDIGKKALEELHRIHPQKDWEVWAIGSEKLEIPGISINQIGFLKTDEELRSVLSASDIYLMPSRSEGLSLLLLQALACQCIIVGTSVAYIVKHEENGMICPIEDYINLSKNLERVIKDPELLNKLKINARTLAEQFEISNSKQKFEHVLLSFHKKNKVIE